MAISTPKTFVNGDPLPASDLNTYVSDNLTALLNPPSAKVYRTADQSIAASTVTAVLFTAEYWDTASLHSTSSNTSRLTAPIAGLYVVTWFVRMGPFTLTSNHYSAVQVRVNGAVVDESLYVLYSSMSTNYSEGSGATTLKLSASDYVELHVYQNTGSAADVDVAIPPTLAMTWVGLG